MPITPVVVVHAGAGRYEPEFDSHRAECLACLREALDRACAALEQGGDAVAAVRAAVEPLEDFPYFNAGTGSAISSDGTVEMSAALMRGSDRQAGAVAGIRTIRHPIAAAHTVLESPQVLVVGPDADRVAIAAGHARQPNEAFITEMQRVKLVKGTGPAHGTVGAVCLDGAGMLAAATSTGGISGQPPGRVGDAPLFGAGTWADGRVAISCTGEGEAFIRAQVAGRVSTCLEFGLSLEEATARVLADVDSLGAYGGLIAVAADGTVAMPFNSETMVHGYWRAGHAPEVDIPRPGGA